MGSFPFVYYIIDINVTRKMTYRGGDDVVGNLEIFLGDPAIG